MSRSRKPAWAVASRAPTWRSPSRRPVAWGRLAGPPPPGYVSRSAGCGTRRGDRQVSVNLLIQFVGRHDVEVCVESRIDAAVIAFGGDRSLVAELHDAG